MPGPCITIAEPVLPTDNVPVLPSFKALSQNIITVNSKCNIQAPKRHKTELPNNSVRIIKKLWLRKRRNISAVKLLVHYTYIKTNLFIMINIKTSMKKIYITPGHFSLITLTFSSVLWHCWLEKRMGVWLAKDQTKLYAKVLFYLQCFDAVGWVAGRTSVL